MNGKPFPPLQRDQLPNDCEALKDLILQLASSYQETLGYLQSENLLLKRFRYGQSGERKKKNSTASNNNAEQGSSSKTKVPRAPKSRETHPGRHPFPDHLPREEVTHDLKAEDKACDNCGGLLSLIGCEEREQLETISLKFIVKKHRRQKYACRCCGETIRLAPAPCEAIDKGLAGPHLLAQVLVDKYAYHLPLYRQEQRFKFHGLHLSRATLWNWVRLSANTLAPLVQAMKEDLLVLGHVFSDDTTMPTLGSRTPETLGKQAKRNYMWVYTGLSANRESPMVIYDYTCGRGAKYPSSFLKDFNGYLQTDAYCGYLPLVKNGNNVIHLGCWSHVRRKFVEALVANPDSIAQEMIDKIGQLYGLEKHFKDEGFSLVNIVSARHEKALPILQEIHQWLVIHHPITLPKSLLGKAIGYALSHWETFVIYVKDGRLEIDNNRSERCIKGVVIGRKNYLFVGSERGGHAAATLYSLIETCKQNHIDPLAYLANVLERIPNHLNKNIRDLLPYNWKSSQTTQTHHPPPQKIA